ncbi:MAG: 6-phosphofructokinase [Chloroflexi bacterium]|nr:6-phosphofructokinase [Chloroflexota bacterium]
MAQAIRRIGVLTGGGDCAGLNAVIRAVTKSAIFQHGLEVYGIEDGFLGLVQNRIRPLGPDDVSGILTQGGTILGSSNKCDPSQYATRNRDGKIEKRDVTNRCLDHIDHHRLDALVVIGGDGTMSGAANFVHHGINCVGVPKTIDNDLYGTDVTFGFATACHVATSALDRIRTTAASHHRAMVVELMGRNAGWIALHSGIASGADIILIPEIPFDIEEVCERLQHRHRRGAGFSIVVVAEGARPSDGSLSVSSGDADEFGHVQLGGVGNLVTAEIEQRTGYETRVTILCHVLRGGTPTAFDRVLATRFGIEAIDAAHEGDFAKMVALSGGEIVRVPIEDGVSELKTVDPGLFDVAGVFFG